jgi:hypothetical protein
LSSPISEASTVSLMISRMTQIKRTHLSDVLLPYKAQKEEQNEISRRCSGDKLQYSGQVPAWRVSLSRDAPETTICNYSFPSKQTWRPKEITPRCAQGGGDRSRCRLVAVRLMLACTLAIAGVARIGKHPALGPHAPQV